MREGFFFFLSLRRLIFFLIFFRSMRHSRFSKKSNPPLSLSTQRFLFPSTPAREPSSSLSPSPRTHARAESTLAKKREREETNRRRKKKPSSRLVASFFLLQLSLLYSTLFLSLIFLSYFASSLPRITTRWTRLRCFSTSS